MIRVTPMPTRCEARSEGCVSVRPLAYRCCWLPTSLPLPAPAPALCCSSAVKAKMTRSDFVARNTDVAGLTHIPASFFGGLYDELAVQGLPVADHVSLEPARHAAPRQPAPEALAAIRHIVRSPAQTMRESAEYVRESAGQALSWLRRAVASLPVVQVPHAATVAVPALAAAGAVASPPTTGRSVAGSPSATHVP